MQIKIDKNISLPISKYPFDDMQVGDSFEAESTTHHMHSRFQAWRRKTKSDFKFTIRQITPSRVRVWRIK